MKLDRSIIELWCPNNHAMFGDKVVPFLQFEFKILEQNTLKYKNINTTSTKLEMVFKMDLDSVMMMPRDPTQVEDITINHGRTITLSTFFGTYFEVKSVSPADNTAELVLIGYCTYDHD